MKEVLNVIKQMIKDGCISQEVAEKYCPEIKKYKDEIVKKQILELIRQHSVNSNRCMMEEWVCAHAQLQPFKPSDEQMKALAYAVFDTQSHSYHDNLSSLEQQLKKLREG